MNMQAALELKPRGMGELLDVAVRLYRNNFWKLVGMMALVQVPAQILMLVISFVNVSGSPFAASFTPRGYTSPLMQFYEYVTVVNAANSSFLNSFIQLVMIQVTTALLTRAIAGLYLGEEMGVRSAYQKMGRAWLSLLWISILVIFLVIGLLIWWIIPIIGWFTGIGILIFFSFAISPLVAPVVVVEGTTGYDAVRRAWDLVRKRFWWLVGFTMLLSIFGVMVIQVPVWILQAVMLGTTFQALPGDNSMFMIQIGIQSLADLALNLLYLPLQAACLTLLYFDLRVRQEGFDLAITARQMENTSLTGWEAARLVPVGQQRSLVTWPELGNFALLSLASVAFYGGLYILIIGLFGG